MSSPLADLDELVLKCKDDKAKSYIKEAILCYKSGAFRSAIVSTWIAVFFDIVDKLKELALSGDKEAETHLQNIDKFIKKNDISQLLIFERDILKLARDKLELISHIEFLDLERLQQDRNRCAHPSILIDGDIFNPSAELARVHIRSAVEYLLQYPPSQGKSALESLLKEVHSEYFPTEINKAVTALANSPIKRARISLVRNFIIVLLKEFLNNEGEYKEKLRISTALNAVENIYKELYDLTFSEKLSSIIKALDDKKFCRTLSLIQNLSCDLWVFFEDDVKQKIEIYVENLPKDKLIYLEFLLGYKQLSSFAKARINKLTRQELISDDVLFFTIPKEVGDRLINLYINSNSYRQATDLSPIIKLYANDFTKEQIEKIIKGYAENSQVKDSFESGSVISSIIKMNKLVSSTEVNEWLRTYAKNQ